MFARRAEQQNDRINERTYERTSELTNGKAFSIQEPTIKCYEHQFNSILFRVLQMDEITFRSIANHKMSGVRARFFYVNFDNNDATQ